MLIGKTIKELNKAIADGIKDGNIKAYAVAEKMTVDKSTYLKSEGQTISIDDNFDAVLWHRLETANLQDYNGRGSTNQKLVTNRVVMVCYSKSIDFSTYLLSKINSNNTLSVTAISFEKEALIKKELPEAYRNFNIDHYFFTINYESKQVIDGNCLDKFCF